MAHLTTRRGVSALTRISSGGGYRAASSAHPRGPRRAQCLPIPRTLPSRNMAGRTRDLP